MRTGAQYIASLDDGRDVQLAGIRIGGISREGAFLGAVQSVAQIYDCQFHPPLANLFTVEGNDSNPQGRIYHVPQNVAELRTKAQLIEHIARLNGGTMGRTPDYVPLILAGLLDAAALIGTKNAAWARNIENYYAYCRENDLFLAHSFADRQVDRSLPSGQVEHLSYESLDEGAIRVTGVKAVATSAPIANEFLVVTPPRVGLAPQQALFFAVPVRTEGLRFVCRQSLAQSPTADYPLSSRFDEIDAWAIFKNVRVPAERVFLAGDIELVSKAWRNLLTLAYYHILIRSRVKAELFLGLSSLVAQYLGLTAFQGIREDLADMARYAETIRAFIRAAEADAITTRAGIAMPNPHCLAVGHMYAIEHHHRLREILLGIAGQSLLMAPSLSDAGSSGATTPGQSDNDEERRRIFRLAWDLSGSAFAGRQYMFEIFNGRDLTRNRLAFHDRYDLNPGQTLAKSLIDAEAIQL